MRFPLIIVALVLAGPAGAAVSVSTDAQLVAAVNAAKPGDRIELAPGSYPAFVDTKVRDFGPLGLTITSADPGHPASIAGFGFTNWKNATLSQVVVTAGSGVIASAGITVDHVDFSGAGSSASALWIGNGCVDCRLQNSLVHGFAGGVSLNGTQLTPYPNATAIPNPGPVTILNNEFWDLSQDVIHSTYSNKTTIVHNTFHDLRDPGDGSHPDAIQFENLPYGAHYAMEDEVVTDNLFYQGATAYGFQAVFLHGGQDGVQTLPRAVVERNVGCVNSQYNGVYLTGGVGFSVRDNYMIGQLGMKVFVTQGTGGVISGNQANSVFTDGNDAATKVSGNTQIATTDCQVALAYAAKTGAGAQPRALLGPLTAAAPIKPPPAVDLAPQVADLTAKLAAAQAQVAALTQQLADAGKASAAQAAQLSAVTAERDALKAKIAAYIAARAALGL